MNTIQASRLAGLPRGIPTPFRLELEDATFTVVDILRHLPGRRLTVGVDDPVRGPGVLKLFFGSRAQRDFQRARRGQEAFVKAGVLTTPVIAERTGKVAWLLFARLVGYEHADARDGVTLAGILGRLHHYGYAHNDLHLGNFLRAGDATIYCIDGDALVPKILSVRNGLASLAILLAQFPVPARPDVEACLVAYLSARGEAPATGTLVLLQRLLAEATRRRAAHYLAKSLRDCTEFAVERAASRRLFFRRECETAFRTFALDPARWFGSDADVLKRGRSATVVRLSVNGVPLVAKRYNITGLFHRLRRIFRPRARKAWRNGLLLDFLGIPTAVPLGLVETGPRFWSGPAYVLMEGLGGKDLATLTAGGLVDRFTLQELADILSWLQRAGLTHGDLKSTNFVLHEGRLRLIDVDAVVGSPGGQREDVRRLLANWPEGSAVRLAVAGALRDAGVLRED